MLYVCLRGGGGGGGANIRRNDYRSSTSCALRLLSFVLWLLSATLLAERVEGAYRTKDNYHCPTLCRTATGGNAVAVTTQKDTSRTNTKNPKSHVWTSMTREQRRKEIVKHNATAQVKASCVISQSWSPHQCVTQWGPKRSVHT